MKPSSSKGKKPRVKRTRKKGSQQHHQQQQEHHHKQDPRKGGSGHAGRSQLRGMISSLVGSLAAQATSSLGDDRAPAQRYGNVGVFDLYLFAHSWAPRFCCTDRNKCIEQRLHVLGADAAPHGLWPAFGDADSRGHTYPAYCAGTSEPNSPWTREGHEWNKHGTCSGLVREAYAVEEARVHEAEEMSELRGLLREVAGEHISVDEVQELSGGEQWVALKSDAHCRLEELTTCWSRLPDGRVGEQRSCPLHLLASSRNSAIVQHGCSRVWIDAAQQCQFIDKALKRVLKEGLPEE